MEAYEPNLATIAAEAKRIREEGFKIERTGVVVPPWGDKRYGTPDEYSFPVIETPNGSEFF